MVAYAKEAKSAGMPVHATFWDRDSVPKTTLLNSQREDGRPVVFLGPNGILVRLAADPDPRKGP
jgi:hypothetical protein